MSNSHHRRLSGMPAVGLAAIIWAAWLGIAVAQPNTLTETRQLTHSTGIARDRVLVRVVSGTVDWQRKPGAWQTLATDAALRSGDTIRTADGALLVLELPLQAGFVHVLGGSQLAISDLKQLPGKDGPQEAAFRLNNGRALVRLRKFNRMRSRFHVDTPGGSAAVRGTEFVVAVDAQAKTSVGVTSGRVAVLAQGKSLDLNPGQATTFAKGAAPVAALTVRPVPITLKEFLPGPTSAVVTGTAGVGTTVYVNGLATAVGPDGAFSATVPILPETTQIIIESLDATGHLETMSLSASGAPGGG